MLKQHAAAQQTFSSQVSNCFWTQKLWALCVKRAISPPQFFLCWCGPTQIGAETWHFNVISITLFTIECFEAWSLRNKGCVTVQILTVWTVYIKYKPMYIHIHTQLCHEFYFYVPYTFLVFGDSTLCLLWWFWWWQCVLDDIKYTQYTAVQYNTITYCKTL